jgi:hypothetical protein
MSEASNLIERMERETGTRIDANNGDNMAMNSLMGAISRLMGYSPTSYRPVDDVVAGTLIRHQMSAEYEREQEGNKIIANMLSGGMSPDDLKDFLGE